MRTNYMLKSVVYEITDYLGCGSEYQTIIGNKIMEIIDKIMELDNNGTMTGVIDELRFNEYDMCIDIENGLTDETMKLFRELELGFYRGYFANKEFLDLDDLEIGLDTFKSCFSGLYGKYTDDFGDELYKRKYIM